MFRAIYQRSAWHYTTERNFRKIAESGVLLPAAGMEAHEEPVVWFSLNREWEQTACKGIKTPEGQQSLTKDQTKALCGGLVRFGYPKRLLVPWPEGAAKARISNDTRTALEKAGRMMGANPSEWLGHLGPMSIRLFTIEIERDGNWVRVATPKRSSSGIFEPGTAGASDWRILGIPAAYERARIAIFIDLKSMIQDGAILHFWTRDVRLEDITSKLPAIGTPDADRYSEAVAARNRPDYWTASREIAEEGLSEEGQREVRSWFVLIETGANYFSYTPVSQSSFEVDCERHIGRLTSLTIFRRDGSVQSPSGSIPSPFAPITPGSLFDNARRRYCKCANPGRQRDETETL